MPEAGERRRLEPRPRLPERPRLRRRQRVRLLRRRLLQRALRLRPDAAGHLELLRLPRHLGPQGPRLRQPRRRPGGRHRRPAARRTSLSADHGPALPGLPRPAPLPPHAVAAARRRRPARGLPGPARGRLHLRPPLPRAVLQAALRHRARPADPDLRDPPVGQPRRHRPWPRRTSMPWYTETQWFPKLDYYRLGDAPFGLDRYFTYFHHSGRQLRQHPHRVARSTTRQVFAFLPYDPRQPDQRRLPDRPALHRPRARPAAQVPGAPGGALRPGAARGLGQPVQHRLPTIGYDPGLQPVGLHPRGRRAPRSAGPGAPTAPGPTSPSAATSPASTAS